MYWNQYMTNVAGAASEGRLLSYAYSEEMRASKLTFNIPVYLNMPDTAVPAPTGDGSPNTKLSSLTVNAGALSPEFRRDIREYTVIVPNEIERITVTASPLNAAASVAGTGEYALNVGVNTVTLTVTAESGASETYTLSGRAGDNHRPLRFQRGRACFGRRARHGVCRVYFVARRERRNAHRDGRHGRCQGTGRADVYRRFCEDHV